MGRDDETAARLARIREMFEGQPPEIIVGSAAVMDPEALKLADAFGKSLHEHIKKHRQGTALVILAASAIGYALGLSIDTNIQGAGEALDITLGGLARVLRWGAENGFAQRREDDANARAGNNGAAGG